MEIANLTFIVTDDCNYNCTYCRQKKEKKTITREIIRAAVDFFYPYLKSSDKIRIGFYANYSELRQDFFQVEGNNCFLCPEKEACRLCPPPNTGWIPLDRHPGWTRML